VKLKLTDDKMPSKKTTVKHKNLNPEWNEPTMKLDLLFSTISLKNLSPSEGT